MSQSADENAVRKWYVLRTFSGREKKVKQYLEQEAERRADDIRRQAERDRLDVKREV